MNWRWRSPSLFITFAGAFLGVLLLGTLLQGVLIVGIVRPLMTRLETSRGELISRQAAQEITASAALPRDFEIVEILKRYRPEGDFILLLYKPVDGPLLSARPFPPGLTAHLAQVLGWEIGPEHAPPRPGHRPPRRPGGRPRFDSARPEGDRLRAPPQILSRSQVIREAEVVGEVVALQMRPRFPFPPSTPPLYGLLFLPVALLLAGTAGLILFRTLLRRVRELERLAARVAEGDLDARVTDPGPDEIGRLGARLNRMTERLATAKREIEESERQRRQLFADISHELATPLTSIRGYTETLLNPKIQNSETERSEFMQNVLDESKRMDLLIQDLLELTRLEAGVSPLAQERLDWTALVHNTMRRFERLFQQAGLQIAWNGPTESAWIEADGRRMEQVIDNLLTNELRYVPSGGHVTLELSPVPDSSPRRHRLTVRDDGPGFPAQDLPHVFDRFYRGGARTSEGTGLGLAIVYEIVQRHGGSVRVENCTPQGAAIHVELPAA